MRLEQELKAVLREGKTGTKRAQQKVERIIGRIRKGESLGNPLKDFLFVSYQSLGKEGRDVEKNVRRFQAQVKENQGQQVLLRYQQRRIVDHGGCFGAVREEAKTDQLNLGILEGEIEFDLQHGAIVLPIDRYVQRSSFRRHLREPWDPMKGPLKIEAHDYLRLYPYLKHERRLLEIVVGNVEVQFEFTGPRFDGGNQKYDLPFKSRWLERHPPDEEYFSALKALGIGVPENLQKRYQQQIELEKKEVLEGIRRNERDVSHHLRKALELGMHQEERTLQLEPGVTMNVPDYVRAQCQKYNVKLPG